MRRAIREWLGWKWQKDPDPTLLDAYRATFASSNGQRVLRHMMDSVYCTVYEGSDPLQLATHNGRRSFVHEILMNLDATEHPDKYEMKEERSIEHSEA